MPRGARRSSCAPSYHLRPRQPTPVAGGAARRASRCAAARPPARSAATREPGVRRARRRRRQARRRTSRRHRRMPLGQRRAAAGPGRSPAGRRAAAGRRARARRAVWCSVAPGAVGRRRSRPGSTSVAAVAGARVGEGAAATAYGIVIRSVRRRACRSGPGRRHLGSQPPEDRVEGRTARRLGLEGGSRRAAGAAAPGTPERSCSPRRTRSITAIGGTPPEGGLPVAAKATVAAHECTSEAGVASSPYRISGARYPGVPRSQPVWVSRGRRPPGPARSR